MLGFEHLKKITPPTTKQIKGYDNYIITSNGKIKNTIRQEFIKPVKDKDGYLRVILCKNSNVKAFQVHRLVAEIFIPVPKRYNPKIYPIDKLEINHLDGNRSNNSYINLEWCRSDENKLIMSISQTYKKNCGYKDLIVIYKGDKDKMLAKYNITELVYDKIRKLYPA